MTCVVESPRDEHPPLDIEERCFATALGKKKIDLKFSHNNLDLLENYYFSPEEHIRVKWVFNEKGRIRRLDIYGYPIILDISKAPEDHSPITQLRKWHTAILERETIPENKRQTLAHAKFLESCNYVYGTFNELPKVAQSIQPTLFDLPYAQRYQHLINLGHCLGRNIKDQVQTGIFPEVRNTYPGQLHLSELTSEEYAILHKIPFKFAAVNLAPIGLAINYEKYRPKNPQQSTPIEQIVSFQ
jgi:hypothetical protein